MFKKYWFILFALFMQNTTMAQPTNDTIVRLPDGKIKIESTVIATNGCYSVGKAVVGVPSGEREIKNTLGIIYPLQHSGAQFCTMVMKAMKVSLIVDVPDHVQAIIIYTTDSYKHSVSARALALPHR